MSNPSSLQVTKFNSVLPKAVLTHEFLQLNGPEVYMLTTLFLWHIPRQQSVLLNNPLPSTEGPGQEPMWRLQLYPLKELIWIASIFPFIPGS